jgi:hypothetical protein
LATVFVIIFAMAPKIEDSTGKMVEKVCADSIWLQAFP